MAATGAITPTLKSRHRRQEETSKPRRDAYTDRKQSLATANPPKEANEESEVRQITITHRSSKPHLHRHSRYHHSAANLSKYNKPIVTVQKYKDCNTTNNRPSFLQAQAVFH
jgi:hypothetical protein